jgi:hypothetical protein
MMNAAKANVNSGTTAEPGTVTGTGTGTGTGTATSAPAAAARPAPVKQSAATRAFKDFATFQKGWLHNRTERQTVLRAKWQDPTSKCAPKLTHRVAVDLLWIVRSCLEPLFRPSPMFIITDHDTAGSGKMTIGLTVWGATATKTPVLTADEWYHETCPDISKQQKDNMYRFARYVNTDWIVAPVLAFLLRNLLPWASEAEAAKLVVLAEMAAPSTLPVLQFAGEGEEKIFVNMQLTGQFNCLQLHRTLVVDMIQGGTLDRENRRKAKIAPADIALTLFLLHRNAKLRRLTEVFDTCFDKCQRMVWKRLRNIDGPRVVQRSNAPPAADMTEEAATSAGTTSTTATTTSADP